MSIKSNLLLCLSLFIISCNGDDSPRIDGDLVPYFERFKDEGASRGVVVDYETAGVEGKILKIINSGVLGQCVFLEGDDTYDQVQISKDYWETANELEKEFVVFHELGHCILDRGHTNVADSEGNCLSMMYDGFSTSCLLVYGTDNREELLNELFQ